MNTAPPTSPALTAAPSLATTHSCLEHFPIAFFSTVMGLAGLTLAWQKAHAVLGAPPIIIPNCGQKSINSLPKPLRSMGSP